ncbi:MAG: hypothetical protein AAFQ05_00720 [Pseudomonadota bacterium]
MTVWEIVLGVGIGLALVAAACAFAFRPSRHDIRGNGDYSQNGSVSNRQFDDFGDGGGGGSD